MLLRLVALCVSVPRQRREQPFQAPPPFPHHARQQAGVTFGKLLNTPRLGLVHCLMLCAKGSEPRCIKVGKSSWYTDPTLLQAEVAAALTKCLNRYKSCAGLVNQDVTLTVHKLLVFQTEQQAWEYEQCLHGCLCQDSANLVKDVTIWDTTKDDRKSSPGKTAYVETLLVPSSAARLPVH